MDHKIEMNEFYHSELVQKALKQKLIRFDAVQSDEIKYIIYNGNVKRVITNTEEKIQAQTYLSLILNYQYPKQRIRQYVSAVTEADKKIIDMIVYDDDDCHNAFIVVECKKEEVSEMEFQRAVKQSFLYTKEAADTAKYIWITSGIKNEYFIFDKECDFREIIPDIPKYGSTTIVPYKYIKDGIDQNGDRFDDLKTVAQAELMKRFQLAHQVLRSGNEFNSMQAFDELNKLIFCKLWDERSCEISSPYSFQKYSAETTKQDDGQERIKKQIREIIRLSERVKALYEYGRREGPELFKDSIRLSPQRINTVVGYFQDISLSVTDMDGKGDAFDSFMGSLFWKNFKQSFTPRSISKFMVSALPIEAYSKVLDPCCGSGGFLLYALNKVRERASSAAKKRVNEWKEDLDFFAQNKLYGIELNERIIRMTKMNMMVHNAGYTNVVVSDALMGIREIQKINPGFEENSFDFVIANSPANLLVKKDEKSYLADYDFGKKEIDWLDIKASTAQMEFRASQRAEVLFVEQCHKFLKPGGFLGIVLPDGILTNSTMQYVRDSIEEKYRIAAVVSLPQTAFTFTGTAVKSSILFLRKYSEEKTQRIRKSKQNLKDELREKSQYELEYSKIQAEKAHHIKKMEGFHVPSGFTLKEIKDMQEYKDWKKEVVDHYNKLIADKKEQMEERYFTQRKADLIPNKLADYDIYMAAAEDIGYDALGKPTVHNDLVRIANELGKFIINIVDKEEV